MRRSYERQRRFDCSPIAEVSLNLECRDEVVPVLVGLQHLFTNHKLRHKVVKLVADDLNRDTRRDVGRRGMDDWQVVVLAAVRLGCNYDYDKLQDQVENHRSLRAVMGIGEWQDCEGISYRRIRDTLCELKPETIAKLNQAIVSAGQTLAPEAASSVRADSFVVETDIHYPTESRLIWDGVRSFAPLCVELADELGMEGWRQTKHLTKKIKKLVQNIGRLASSKSPNKKDAMESLYGDLLERTSLLLQRAKTLVETAYNEASSITALAKIKALSRWIELTEQVCDTARQRVLLGEKVPNCDKLFSLFETHTQLYRRGKAGQPNQYGRLVLVYEDGAGFISHYHLLGREEGDKDVVVEQQEEMPVAELVSEGAFKARAHEVEGKALLIAENGKKTLRFEGFNTINGPDLRVYLASDLGISDAIEVGKLKGTKGNFNYELDPSIDTDKYNNVLVWCEPFGILFSYSMLG